MHLGNQFRTLEADEVVFLDAIREEQRVEERAHQDIVKRSGILESEPPCA